LLFSVISAKVEIQVLCVRIRLDARVRGHDRASLRLKNALSTVEGARHFNHAPKEILNSIKSFQPFKSLGLSRISENRPAQQGD